MGVVLLEKIRLLVGEKYRSKVYHVDACLPYSMDEKVQEARILHFGAFCRCEDLRVDRTGLRDRAVDQVHPVFFEKARELGNLLRDFLRGTPRNGNLEPLSFEVKRHHLLTINMDEEGMAKESKLRPVVGEAKRVCQSIIPVQHFPDFAE